MNFHRYRILRRYYLKRAQYLLMRQVVPIRPQEFRALAGGHRVFANSIPKAGTNLINRILKMVPGTVDWWTYHLDEKIPDIMKQLASVKRGQIVTAHLPWSEELDSALKEREFKRYLIVRDLRDVVVSGSYYVTRKDDHDLYSYFNSLPSSEERISAYIEGVDGALLPSGVSAQSIGDFVSGYLPWWSDEDCLIVKFEDLIGPAGGGSEDRQREAIASVLRHLSIKVDDGQLDFIAEHAFSRNARTFRKGLIGDWKNHFTEEHKAAFKACAGQYLVQMGYEKDLDW